MRGMFPVLIIDEAKRALPSGTASQAAQSRTLDALHLLTSLSKEQGHMNVLLAASEHSEPFRLEQLGFKTSHMTETVVACEVPPAEMRQLLVEQWHCGPALAEGLLSVYGGHVWRSYLALGKLGRDKAGFEALSAFAPESSRSLAACIKTARSGRQEMAGLEAMLRELAIRGYVAIDDDTDPRVEVVSQHNVGGVVTREVSAPGLPPEAWTKGVEAVLAVSSQGMRLQLARALELAPSAYTGPRGAPSFGATALKPLRVSRAVP